MSPEATMRMRMDAAMAQGSWKKAWAEAEHDQMLQAAKEGEAR